MAKTAVTGLLQRILVDAISKSDFLKRTGARVSLGEAKDMEKVNVGEEVVGRGR